MPTLEPAFRAGIAFFALFLAAATASVLPVPAVLGLLVVAVVVATCSAVLPTSWAVGSGVVGWALLTALALSPEAQLDTASADLTRLALLVTVAVAAALPVRGRLTRERGVNDARSRVNDA